VSSATRFCNILDGTFNTIAFVVGHTNWSGDGREQRGTGAGGGHSHGGGQGRVGARPSATQQASSDAIFIATLAVNRDRQITAREVREAVAADVAEGLTPAAETGNTLRSMSERGNEPVRRSPPWGVPVEQLTELKRPVCSGKHSGGKGSAESHVGESL